MRSRISPARIQAALDRRNYQNFLTYNFSLNEWSGLFHSLGAFAAGGEARSVPVWRGAEPALAARRRLRAGSSREPARSDSIARTFSVLVAAMPVAHVTLSPADDAALPRS
ncbi:unnamed protein product [Chrysodeixis includens]|uniref:Uncharacterized protein n=1 Tax=Chrysodeixis includens TaxID=689277 RepID=A0A9N8KW54_CHRIL|nr:unnamed protein product [Chrysodeixis includens]